MDILACSRDFIIVLRKDKTGSDRAPLTPITHCRARAGNNFAMPIAAFWSCTYVNNVHIPQLNTGDKVKREWSINCGASANSRLHSRDELDVVQGKTRILLLGQRRHAPVQEASSAVQSWMGRNLRQGSRFTHKSHLGYLTIMLCNVYCATLTDPSKLLGRWRFPKRDQEPRETIAEYV